jgi:GNAT superfamily N-acetyltransferase
VTVDVAPIGSEDARRILRAYMAEMVSTYTGRPATEAEVDEALREHPGDGLTPPRGLFLLAREDGAVVGCAGLELQPGGIGLLQRLFVVPARRRQGIGARIVTAVERVAAEHGASVLRLDTRSDLAAARALYDEAGFAEIEPYGGGPYSDLFFEKRLS